MGWRRFFTRNRSDRERAAELQSYIDLETDDNLARGMSPVEALRAARVRLGNVSQIREEIWTMNTFGFLESVSRDIAYALRNMRKNRAFTVIAILTLSLGIGGSTTMFTVIRSVLLKPLAYHDPDRLVRISGVSTIGQYEEFRSSAHAYTDMGAFLGTFGDVTLYGKEGPEVLKQARVSANFLRIVGIEPVLGRSFRAEDEAAGGPPAMIISSELWQRRFGGDPMTVGKIVTLDTGPSTIIGILPIGFSFPAAGLDVWATPPLPASGILPPAVVNSPVLVLFGRLLPQMSIEQANAELTVLNNQYAIAHPGMLDAKPNSPHTLTPLKDQLVANVRAMLWMLFGAVTFVLMIGCANVAGLMLARATSRSREFALRATLGADRGRLVRQILVENLVMASIGGAMGLLLARWSLGAITSMTSFALPRAGEIRLDMIVIAFAASMSIVTGILFGLAPALAVSRLDLFGFLRTSEASAARRSNGILRFANARALLVIGQVALSLVLLIGATLLMESLARIHGVNPGFNPRNLLTMQIVLSPSRYDTDQKRAAFFDELIQRVHSIPGIENAAVSTSHPMSNLIGRPVQVAGRQPMMLNERPIAWQQNITREYFRTVEIPLRRGREFSARDGQEAAPAVIINERLAQLFWPEYPNGENPIGQHLVVGIDPQPKEIVGIVADTRRGLESEVRPEIYLSYDQATFPISAFTLRTKDDPMRVAVAVRDVVLAIDPNQPITGIKTLEDVVEDSLGQRRLVVSLLQLFAAVALLLALIGIYGAIAYSVGQRTREVGLRMALGAHPHDILRLLLREGFGITLIGVLLGLGGAFSLTRVLKSFLFQISPADPLTFLGIALLFIAVALIASYIPVRRALHIDPLAVLRHE